jgi:glioma pathogenesis-related protein 2
MMKFWQTRNFKIAGLSGALALGTASSFQLGAQADELDSFRQQALNTHNALRQEHASAPLRPNSALNNLAQDWAQQLAAMGKMRHRPDSHYGENVYAGWSSQRAFDVNGITSVQSWYDEVKNYNFSTPGFSAQTGHFTQVVWKNSGKLGCGKATSKDSKVFVVCNYEPPGNYQGQFAQNVLPPR